MVPLLICAHLLGLGLGLGLGDRHLVAGEGARERQAGLLLVCSLLLGLGLGSGLGLGYWLGLGCFRAADGLPPRRFPPG